MQKYNCKRYSPKENKLSEKYSFKNSTPETFAS
jgi:hypothetical protein